MHYYVSCNDKKGWIGGPKAYYDFSFSGYIMNVEDKGWFLFFGERKRWFVNKKWYQKKIKIK